MPSTGAGPSSTIITALERTWAEMRDKHPDVPDVVFITGRGMKKLEVTWGHWCPDRWQEFGARNTQLPEVFISGECLAQGAGKVLCTLLHEAAHALAHVRGVKDTSRGHRYHNQRFVKLAVELGLEGPEVANEVRGWSACTLPDSVPGEYETFDSLSDAITVCIGGALETGAEAPAAPKKAPAPKYACGCPDRLIRMSKTVYDSGPILCGLCEQPFLEQV